jgi:creatinine amidohydrolase
MIDDWSTSSEIIKAHPEIAVVGIGAIEQHGRHLPIGTDWMIISDLSRRVANEFAAWLLPAIPISMSECHGSIPGTVWLKPATLSAVLQDIASSLHAQGICKLLVLNGHGGNFILESTIQSINNKFPDMLVVMPPDVWPAPENDAPIFETPGTDLHAGEIETSIQLFLNPALVKAERVDFVPPVGREFLDYARMDLISPDGVWGNPSKGDAGKGERAIQAQVKAIKEFAQQAFGSKG